MRIEAGRPEHCDVWRVEISGREASHGALELSAMPSGANESAQPIGLDVENACCRLRRCRATQRSAAFIPRISQNHRLQHFVRRKIGLGSTTGRSRTPSNPGAVASLAPVPTPPRDRGVLFYTANFRRRRSAEIDRWDKRAPATVRNCSIRGRADWCRCGRLVFSAKHEHAVCRCGTGGFPVAR